MSCNKANNCQKYKMNIGNPNDWENPCNLCHYNISDYDSGYNKAIDDFAKLIKQRKFDYIKKCVEFDSFVDEISEQLKAGEQNDR